MCDRQTDRQTEGKTDSYHNKCHASLCCTTNKSYGLEVCALPKRVLQSLDFTVNCVLMSLFKSSNIVVIEQYSYFFHIELPSVQLQRRFEKFFGKCCR